MLNRREEKKLLVLKHLWNCAGIWIYTDVLSGFVNYLESDLITLCVCMLTYVVLIIAAMAYLFAGMQAK